MWKRMRKMKPRFGIHAQLQQQRNSTTKFNNKNSTATENSTAIRRYLHKINVLNVHLFNYNIFLIILFIIFYRFLIILFILTIITVFNILILIA